MRLHQLTFAEARRRHPKEVSALLAKLRSGKSKHKDAEGDVLTWTYDCSVRVNGFSFLDILQGKGQDERLRKDAMTLEEKVADQVERTATVLQASIGRWWGSELVANPPEVDSHARAGFIERMRKDRAHAALPQTVKDRQAAEALAQLRGTPGFIEVAVASVGGRRLRPKN